jgi:hypothetical protein
MQHNTYQAWQKGDDSLEFALVQLQAVAPHPQHDWQSEVAELALLRPESELPQTPKHP